MGHSTVGVYSKRKTKHVPSVFNFKKKVVSRVKTAIYSCIAVDSNLNTH